MTVTPRLASTILIARDGAEGLELSMIVRNRQIDFASGALVFPGGSLDAGDREARALTDGAEGLDDDALALRVAAIREAFEECGVLLARRDGALVGGEEAARLGARHRADMEAGRITLAALAEAEGLRLAVDLLAPFAHWITPAFMKKRFDTHFFIAAAPEGQDLLHDGGEAVDSLWIRPAAALDEARAGTRTVIFATWLNLEMAAAAANTAEAMAQARARRIVSVEPNLTQEDGRRIMRIPADAGYASAAWEIEDIAKPPKPIA